MFFEASCLLRRVLILSSGIHRRQRIPLQRPNWACYPSTAIEGPGSPFSWLLGHSHTQQCSSSGEGSPEQVLTLVSKAMGPTRAGPIQRPSSSGMVCLYGMYTIYFKGVFAFLPGAGFASRWKISVLFSVLITCLLLLFSPCCIWSCIAKS